MFQKFWNWYKQNLQINQGIVAILFGWQLFHLFWLTTQVVAGRLFGHPLFNPSEFYQTILVLADYAEIPALISGTLLYFNFSKDGLSKKNIIFIILINSQWLHLFWITDEFVVNRFTENNSTILPVWLAWIAIFIDYLELPVIYDTIKNTAKNLLVPKETSRTAS